MKTVLPEEYLEFRRLFNRRQYFEAHEVLEGLWRKEKGKPRDFYHGLIQIAAAFVHLQKGTPQGARELFKKASVYLQPYLPSYQGLDLEDLLSESRKAVFGHHPFPKIYLK